MDVIIFDYKQVLAAALINDKLCFPLSNVFNFFYLIEEF